MDSNFNYEYDVKFEFDSDLLNKLIDLREEIKSFDVLSKYISADLWRDCPISRYAALAGSCEGLQY